MIMSTLQKKAALAAAAFFFFFNIYVFGCIRSYLLHMGSSLGCKGSVTVAPGRLSCPTACEILVHLAGIKPASMYWKADS